MSMFLEWLGHCAFRLTGQDGPSILIDPFDESIGLRVAPYDCDILLVSHEHYDSSARHLVPPGHESVSTKGTFSLRGITFNAIPWWHDEHQGRDFGSVLIFQFDLDGFRIAYMSHIGCVPGQWILERLGEIDLCFVPVGGILAMGVPGAKALVDQMKPRLVVPMHFKLRHLNFTLGPVTEFTRFMRDKQEVQDWEIELVREELPQSPTVLLMRHWPGVAP
jgi:L-ascorbate metabolism protein UlaG (beta-lactamase superfamily)